MGTFTISNLGMYGITNFSAVIYPQQVSYDVYEIKSMSYFFSLLYWVLVVLKHEFYQLQILQKGEYLWFLYEYRKEELLMDPKM